MGLFDEPKNRKISFKKKGKEVANVYLTKTGEGELEKERKICYYYFVYVSINKVD